MTIARVVDDPQLSKAILHSAEHPSQTDGQSGEDINSST